MYKTENFSAATFKPTRFEADGVINLRGQEIHSAVDLVFKPLYILSAIFAFPRRAVPKLFGTRDWSYGRQWEWR